MIVWRAYRVPAVAAGISLILAAKAIADFAAPPRQWNLPPAAASPAIAAPPPQFAMPPRQDFAESLDRPLFSPSRRPPPAPVKTGAGALPAQQQAALSSLTLIGTIIGPETRIALIKNGSAPVQRVAPGQSVEGWNIVEITKDRVVLRGGGTQQELTVPVPSQSSGTSVRKNK